MKLMPTVRIEYLSDSFIAQVVLPNLIQYGETFSPLILSAFNNLTFIHNKIPKSNHTSKPRKHYKDNESKKNTIKNQKHLKT